MCKTAWLMAIICCAHRIRQPCVRQRAERGTDPCRHTDPRPYKRHHRLVGHMERESARQSERVLHRGARASKPARAIKKGARKLES